MTFRKMKSLKSYELTPSKTKMKPFNCSDEMLYGLVGAIIKQALEDVVCAHKNKRSGEYWKNNALRWFKYSRLFGLTGLDYQYLIRRYKSEINKRKSNTKQYNRID